jgi:hypothetical protein
MASVPTQKITSGAPAESLTDRFHRLATEWEAATSHLSSMSAASNHPAHQAIVALGSQVVPLLLRDMEDHETHWFIALEQITGAKPIPSSVAGNIPEMVKAWLGWAKANGYRW